MPLDPVSSLGITKLWKKSSKEEQARKGVLIVDDEAAFCAMVAEVIAAVGYKVWQANSGEAALRIWARDGGEIGLVLIDLVMPAMDGLTLLSALQRRDPNLSIVIVSGRLDDDTRWLASESGCRFLAKPFDVSELARLASELLGPASTAAGS